MGNSNLDISDSDLTFNDGTRAVGLGPEDDDNFQNDHYSESESEYGGPGEH